MMCLQYSAEGARNHGLLNVDVKAFSKDVNIDDAIANSDEQRKISVLLSIPSTTSSLFISVSVKVVKSIINAQEN